MASLDLFVSVSPRGPILQGTDVYIGVLALEAGAPVDVDLAEVFTRDADSNVLRWSPARISTGRYEAIVDSALGAAGSWLAEAVVTLGVDEIRAERWFRVKESVPVVVADYDGGSANSTPTETLDAAAADTPSSRVPLDASGAGVVS